MIFPHGCANNSKFSDNFIALLNTVTELPNIEFWVYRHPELGYSQEYVQVRYWCPMEKAETKTPPCGFKEFATSLNFHNRIKEITAEATMMADQKLAVTGLMRANGQRVMPFPSVDAVCAEFEKDSAWDPAELYAHFERYAESIKAAYAKSQQQQQ